MVPFSLLILLKIKPLIEMSYGQTVKGLVLPYLKL